MVKIKPLYFEDMLTLLHDFTDYNVNSCTRLSLDIVWEYGCEKLNFKVHNGSLFVLALYVNQVSDDGVPFIVYENSRIYGLSSIQKGVVPISWFDKQDLLEDEEMEQCL